MCRRRPVVLAMFVVKSSFRVNIKVMRRDDGGEGEGEGVVVVPRMMSLRSDSARPRTSLRLKVTERSVPS